jgi:hypothetical protein
MSDIHSLPEESIAPHICEVLIMGPNRMEQFQKAIRKVRQVQRMRKQRGYAFSQADESQARVLKAYDTTQNRGRYGEMASSRPSDMIGGAI